MSEVVTIKKDKKEPEGGLGKTEAPTLVNEGLVDKGAFPIAPPEQVEFEATIAVGAKLQARIHELNDMAHETGWRFALVQSGGSSDADALVRMKAAGYEAVSKADIQEIAKYMGADIPLQTNETLMKKPYGLFKADKERAYKMAMDRIPKRVKGEKLGEGSSDVSAPTMDVEAKPISIRGA